MRRGRGRLDVFTFKEGLLARAAHDLQLHLDELEVTLDGEEVCAEIPLAGLRLMGPVEGGVVHPERYDAARRAEVERAMRTHVLRLDEHPRARFSGRALAQARGYAVEGELTLAGQRARLAFEARNEGGGQYRARFELRPSRWGIAQYRAMLGAIRLEDRVRVDCLISET
jgi:YceI-like protein